MSTHESPSHSHSVELTELLRQLDLFLDGGQAHISFEAAVADFPEERRGDVPEALPYSAWQLIEHVRIAQEDILEFSDPPPGGYKYRAWPADYWPASPTPPGASAWEESLAAIRRDRKRFQALLHRPGVSLGEPFAWGEGQTLLREALLIAGHTSYHMGELVVLRRLLGIWHAA